MRQKCSLWFQDTVGPPNGIAIRFDARPTPRFSQWVLREMVVVYGRGISPRISRQLRAPASCMGRLAGRRPFLLPQSGKRSVTSWMDFSGGKLEMVRANQSRLPATKPACSRRRAFLKRARQVNPMFFIGLIVRLDHFGG